MEFILKVEAEVVFPHAVKRWQDGDAHEEDAGGSP